MVIDMLFVFGLAIDLAIACVQSKAICKGNHHLGTQWENLALIRQGDS